MSQERRSCMEERKIRPEEEERYTEEEKIQGEIRQKAEEEIEIPRAVMPETVEEILQEKKRQRYRNRFRRSGWKYLAGAAAACLCLAGGIPAAYYAVNGNMPGSGRNVSGEDAAAVSQNTAENSAEQKAENNSSGHTGIVSAEDYDEIYDYIEAGQDYLNSMSGVSESGDQETEAAYESASDSTRAAGAANYSGAEQSSSWSDTNVREESVGEGDVVKTDGENLYILNDQKINIVAASSGEMTGLSEIVMGTDQFVTELYLEGDRLIVTYSEYRYADGETDENEGSGDGEFTCADVYDVSAPENPRLLGGISQSGYYNTMRVKDGYVYLVSNFYADTEADREDIPSYIPAVRGQMIDASDIYMPDDRMGREYTVISSFAIADPGERTDSKAVFGSSGLCYVSPDNIYITEMCSDSGDSDVTQTSVRKISYDNGRLEGTAQTKVDGTLNNSFSIDEYEGYLRLVTTVSPASDISLYPMPRVGTDEEDIDSQVKSTNSLYVLDENLETVGEIHDLAEDENVYSARFMGDTGYFVTFRQVDPLFSVDLSDPENPKITGELKIPGFSEYLHPYGEGLLLGIGMDVDENGMTTEGVKLSMFDISDPSSVQEVCTYVIENMYGTDVYNYKAVFVDVEKNLFGFAAYGDSMKYYMFSYDEADGFREVFSRTLSGYGDIRGLYVNDTFYLVAGNTVQSFTMNGFEKIDDIVL